MDNQKCNCKDKISPQAEQAFRLEYSPIDPKTQDLIKEFKTSLAKIHTSINELELPYPTTNESLIASTQFMEGIYNASTHLQLASYYITHALTSSTNASISSKS